ncbi:unnamed protein product, partial [Nesidiocoris tenuis]
MTIEYQKNQYFIALTDDRVIGCVAMGTGELLHACLFANFARLSDLATGPPFAKLNNVTT